MKHYSIKHSNSLDVESEQFILKHHYLKTTRSLLTKELFKLYDGGLLIGVAIFGLPCSANVTKCYGRNTLELRRFATVDGREKNINSWFLGACLKHLRKYTKWKHIVSYADPNYGHTGIIYKATNWLYFGLENSNNPGKLLYKGNKYSKRQVYQKYNGKYIKKALELQKALKNNKAKWVDKKRKHVYFYVL